MCDTSPTTTADADVVDRLLSTEQAAARLGLAVATLNCHRCRRIGPPFIKLGRAVRYSEADLNAYIEARRVDNASTTDE